MPSSTGVSSMRLQLANIHVLNSLTRGRPDDPAANCAIGGGEISFISAPERIGNVFEPVQASAQCIRRSAQTGAACLSQFPGFRSRWRAPA